MKQYNVIYNYNEETNKYTVVCPELFGFILSVKKFEKIKEQTSQNSVNPN